MKKSRLAPDWLRLAPMLSWMKTTLLTLLTLLCLTTATAQTFMPDENMTYTVYAPFTSGYMNGEDYVSGVARENNEYAIEQVSTTADNLPVFRIRQVSTNKYLLHVNLMGVDDSSDLGLTVPHGSQSEAATFTILRAKAETADPRNYAFNCSEGDYVICDTQTYVENGETKYTYLEGYAGQMFYGPYNDSNHLRIAPYVSTEKPKTEYESFDDESVNLWGAAADTTALRLYDGTTLLIPSNMVDGWQDNKVILKGDSVIVFEGVVPVPVIDESFPAFQTFKFNNKYNDILIADAIGTVMPDSINISVGSCIGKTLCPSFSLTDDGATVFYCGKRQLSHRQRVRFDKVLTYTVARPGYRILMVNKLQDATYRYNSRPWGRDVRVKADFLTDLSSNVPTVNINLDNGYSYSSITKTQYLTATISIDGGGVFPDMPETPVNIRGRGNSSWSYNKKPYRLKFNTKQKPFGLTNGKSWVLIAQAQTGSMLTNPMAQRVATMTASQGCNHIIPVELYINGSYRGSYIFTENPGFANNSIDIDETSAYMLELDSNYDEDYKFEDDYYNLPVNVKEPDLTEETDYNAADEKFSTIVSDFNSFTKAVKYGNTATYESMLDIDAYSRYMLVNDVVRNTELIHPKSVKLFRVDMTQYMQDSPYIWGPAWDFDWAFGYDGTHGYCIQRAETDFYARYAIHDFFVDMLQQSELLNADRFRVWTEFMQMYRDELIDYVDDYYAYAAPSFSHNASLWSDGRSYAAVAEQMKEWLLARTDYVYSTMPVYDLPEIVYELGDVNEDGRISIADVVCIVNHLLMLPVDVFNVDKADMDSDACISLADMQLVIRAILDASAEPASVRSRMPRANASLSLTPFTATAGESVEIPVAFNTDETAAGLQMEVVLPEGATLTNVRTAQALAPFRTRLADMGDGRYRVLVFADNGERVPAEAEAGLTLDVTMGQIPTDKENRRIRLAQAYMATPEGSDCALPTTSVLFAEPTAIADVTADDMIVRGGDDLTIQCVKDGTVNIYNLAGQLVCTMQVKKGTTSITLPMGIYVVAGNKVIID